MMAELYNGSKMVRFIWGESCDVPKNQVRLCHYKYEYGSVQNYMNNTVTSTSARLTWKELIRDGFHRSNMTFPDVTSPIR